jgi:hypothetical protein
MNGVAWFLASTIGWAYVQQRAKAKSQEDAWREDLPVNGTDWQGGIYDRMAGADLKTSYASGRNLADSTNADPGRVGQAQLGLEPAWNGNL